MSIRPPNTFDSTPPPLHEQETTHSSSNPQIERSALQVTSEVTEDVQHMIHSAKMQSSEDTSSHLTYQNYLEQAIQTSRETRAKRFSEPSSKFTNEFTKKLKSFENKLDELGQKTLNHALLKDNLENSRKSFAPLKEQLGADHSEVKKAREKGKEEAKKVNTHNEMCEDFIQEMTREFKDFVNTQDLFYNFRILPHRSQEIRPLFIEFAKEQKINKSIDQFVFLNEVKARIQKDKNKIVQLFLDSTQVNIDFNAVDFELHPQASETHNHGKVPVKIIFKLDKTILLQIFYKPRSAEVDHAVIKAFDAINNLSDQCRSIDIQLPTYKIFDYKDENYSLWQYIDGKTTSPYNAFDYIDELPNSEDKTFLKTQLSMIEAICSYLEISDLHGENMIVTNTPEIVPIDLESFQPGSTGLGVPSSEVKKISLFEKEILDPLRERTSTFPIRFLPVATTQFHLSFSNYSDFTSFSKQLEQAIQREGYSLEVSHEVLGQCIIDDYLHDDVPFFTKYNEGIYHGSYTKGLKLAGRKS